jgi:oxaloacetate decarboxylase (Na+ extruding) subunit gamma
MAESLETGLILMAAGMGTVFLLLAMLVWLVGLVSKLSRRLDPPVASPAAAPEPTHTANGELLSVIGAAIKTHRDRHTPR